MRTPRQGTLARAVFDAMHARWCGPDCPPTCRTWNPDRDEQRAAVQAVRQWDNERFTAAVRREQGE